MRRTVAGFAAAAAVLAGLVLAADPAAIWRHARAADPAVLAVGLPSILVALACWSEAYRRLFAAAGATDLAPGGAFAAYGTGAFTKQVVPLGHLGGPAIVAYAYDRAVSLGYDRTFAVVTVGEAVALAGSVTLALVGAESGAAAAVVLLYRLWSYWLLLLVGGVAAAFAATSGRGDDELAAGRE